MRTPARLASALTLFFALSTLTAASVVQQMQFIDAAGAAGDGLGVDVAIDGDTALVGASGVNLGHADQEAAYVFVRAGGVWTLEQKLVVATGSASDFFGDSVDLDGDTALIGARGEGGARGAAYVWVRAGGVWTQQARLAALGGVGGDGFGTSVRRLTATPRWSVLSLATWARTPIRVRCTCSSGPAPCGPSSRSSQRL